MSMMLRTTPDQDKILDAAAVRAGVSKQQFILDAALTAAADHSEQRDELIEMLREQRRDLLDRLGR
ncbi:MAG TPA: DUF1778 domain-containing protein [Microlunatus sp.]|jgi:uncharacterized protein (DUF1778 family)